LKEAQSFYEQGAEIKNQPSSAKHASSCIYGKRLDIEVFFKATKSFSGLGKEYQSRCYDALVVHTTIVFMRYTMLEIESKAEEDPRTIRNFFIFAAPKWRA